MDKLFNQSLCAVINIQLLALEEAGSYRNAQQSAEGGEQDVTLTPVQPHFSLPTGA